MAEDGADRPPNEPSAGAVAAAALLVGAVALPILGLRALFGGPRAAAGPTEPVRADPATLAAAPAPAPLEKAPAETTSDEPAPAGPPPAGLPPAGRVPTDATPSRPPGRRAASPAQGDVEAALARLSDATVASRRRRPQRSAAKKPDREASLRPS